MIPSDIKDKKISWGLSVSFFFFFLHSSEHKLLKIYLTLHVYTENTELLTSKSDKTAHGVFQWNKKKQKTKAKQEKPTEKQTKISCMLPQKEQ